MSPDTKMLSLIYSYYNNFDAVKNQVQNWSRYPENTRRKLQFILIDDCSDERPELHLTFPINLILLTITDSIPWNQPGAKNLGFKFVTTEWAFTSDIDHILSSDMCEKLLKLKKEKSHIYFFSRTENTGGERRPHANSFLIHKDTFWDLGGYDEDFCGNYGKDDILLKDMMKLKYTMFREDSIKLIVYPDLSTDDLNRSTRKNRRLLKKKRKQLEKGKYRNRRLLRFNWEITKIWTM